MDFIKKRENDPEYLKTVIAQRQIVIDEQKRKCDELTKQNNRLKAQNEEINKQKLLKEEAAAKQANNLKSAIEHLQAEIEMLKEQKNESEYMLTKIKIKLQKLEKERQNEEERLKQDFESQKEILTSKITNLEKNLSDLKKYYNVEEKIVEDKKKIIEDSNRDLRGFSNQKQERLLIIQNQQFKNQLQYQSKNLTLQLQKNEKLQEEIKSLKIDIQIHKQMENDLIKRSSLAQNLIKKLYKEIQDIKKTSAQSTHLYTHSQSQAQGSEHSHNMSRASQVSEAEKQKQEIINQLKFDIANLKNEKHYMESVQKVFSKKYETLASLLAQYLENLLQDNQLSSEDEIEGSNKDITLNIHELTTKDIKEWSYQEMETVVHLLLTQLKPFVSKQSLINFPEVKNINVSFIEEAPKEAISLPKISESYQKAYEKQVKKGQNRFKDIPIDISTKIIRSNLREWGNKIKYGNMPINKNKSKSIIEEGKKSFL